MPVTKPDYQLLLPLEDLDEPVSTVINPAEARARSEAARSALDEKKSVRWMEEYQKLRDGGWDWRVAAYIAWASSPKLTRSPRTQAELATDILGLTSDRAIMTWRKKNPVIDETVGVLQSASLWEHRAEVFEALVENARTPDYKTHNDRKLFLELTGDYVPSAKLAAMITKNGFSKNDLNDMSDDELLALARSWRNDVNQTPEETATGETEEE